MDLVGQTETLPADVERDLTRLVDLLQPVPHALREVATSDDTADRQTRMGDWLYGNWYTQQPDPSVIEPSGPPPPDLRGALAVATAASRRWQRGWVVLQTDPSGVCFAGLKEVNRWLYPGQYANIARPGLPPAPGDALSVIELVDDVDEATGFWVSQSAIFTPAPPLARLYFNVGWQHVGPVLGEVTEWLDGTGTKYSLKYPIRLNFTQRVDTLVVYLERAHWDASEPAAIALAGRLRQYLRPATPPLTRRLAPGVGSADDPGANASFGQSRCSALAPAILELIEAGITTQRHAVAKLASALTAASIDPRKPWQVRLT
jgi:hypothetical protein